ncbi:hypothetical protein sscle_01g007710 [Sclerotinia sclerotiorum 1980 UF-70]|uniref:PLL-like beta propeller domain-containing protein n=1 Tax=Sclerotinia sclerotiorum (strain ATCC 18683 / 1980 / Ss-1) TaxID=665079 RepID=A0A1D9PTF2_SCLS1|nr:hypothetical protein sscle_01g007710 [Sclerotinia sclerotiorum 1980 UF-70]
MAVSAIQGVTMSTVRADLESISTDQALWLQSWEANKWSDVDENGVVGLNSNVYHKWYSPSSGWSAWDSMGKNSICAPIAIKYAVNKVAVFIIGFDNLAYAGLSTSDTAFTWTCIGDKLKKLKGGSITACGYDGRIILFGVELSSGKLIHTWTGPGNVWIDFWHTFDGFCLSNPVMVSCKPDCVDVFVFGETHNLKRISSRNGIWGSWQDCLGTYLYDPTAVSVSPGRIDVFGIGSDGQLYQSYVTITGMEIGTITSKSIGALSLSTPKTSVTSPGVFSVTTESAKGVYQQNFYESSNGVWVPQNA